MCVCSSLFRARSVREALQGCADSVAGPRVMVVAANQNWFGIVGATFVAALLYRIPSTFQIYRPKAYSQWMKARNCEACYTRRVHEK